MLSLSIRAEADAAAAARAAQAAELERRRAEKAQSLPEEPAAGASGTALVRVRLPSGQNFQRRSDRGRGRVKAKHGVVASQHPERNAESVRNLRPSLNPGDNTHPDLAPTLTAC